MSSNGYWIIATSSLLAISASLLGSMLMLRKSAMLGDAITHSILPGIVIAYLVSGQKSSLILYAGAIVLGVGVTLMIEWIQKRFSVQNDAAIGLSFTFLFAVGVILISILAQKIDLDQDCVIYGELAYVPLDTWITSSGVNLGPRAFWIMAGLAALNLAFISAAYKELKVSIFDPAFAQVTGLRPVIWRYAQMVLVSLTAVAAFEAVGAILVVAFLVTPAATAYLISQRLIHLFILSCCFGVCASIGGYMLALWSGGSIAGAIALVAGIQFLAVFLIAKLLKLM
jgi:manganese/zinc/iron transport system permease protein